MNKIQELIKKAEDKVNSTMLSNIRKTEINLILLEIQKESINYTRCCTELKDKEEMNLVEYAISEGYTYNNENHYFYKGGRMHLDSNVRDKYIKEVVMDIDITKHL